MKKKYLIVVLILISYNVLAQGREKFNFNPVWKVWVGDDSNAAKINFNDAAWKSVTLPYAWNEDEAFKKDIKDLSTGIAWYRKHFKIPNGGNTKKVFVEFEGLRQAGEVYVNGRYVGLHENGVMAFGFDITPFVKFGNEENIIAVRTNNDWDYREKATNQKYQWEDRNFNVNYGGLTKNVFLHLTGNVYQTLPLFSNLGTSGVYVYADNNSIDVKNGSAIIHAESEVKNESAQPAELQYEVIITDPESKPVKKFEGTKVTLMPGETKTLSASSPVSNLHFWSWGYGYLYTVQTILKQAGKPIDIVSTKTGFRKTAFKDGMIWLNDRVMMVHGYAQRTTNEWPSVGASIPAWLSDYSNGLMVEGNANLVRWMHLTPWKQDIESCDRVGLMQAMPAGDAEHDVQGARWEQRKSLMRDAIVYNRNNPSIIFYESGNESISEEHMGEMKAIRDRYDAHGGRAIGSREMLDSKVAEYGGEMLYTNKSAHIPMWATEYSRDEGSRKFWDNYTIPFHKDGDGPLHNGQDAAAYNRNMESHAVENVKRWFEFWNERPGTGKRVSAGGVNIVFSETNTHHRGAENYRRSGEVDGLRIKKQNFYANQVMWDGWVVPEKPGIHIVGHWNYQDTVVKDVFVISSTDKVELKVNDKSLGFGEKQDGFLFMFKNVQWKPGNILAIGYDKNDKELCKTAINTAGQPIALRLASIKRPVPFIADGHDLSLIEVEVVDAKGNRCPTALNMINYTLDGPAEWRGGMAQGPDNYILAKSFPVEGGVNRILIRSTTTPGVIRIIASADGLRSDTITVSSVSFTPSNGLSKVLPSAGLKGLLNRGPTPAGPSFSVTRKAIDIVKATAGANEDSAFASYDDNELSDWHSDGKLSNAWIEYDLAGEATVSEVVLKLNNFRSRAYPIRITIDGEEVFKGSTKLSLGYCTIVCHPKQGKKVRIQLLQPSTLTEDNSKEVSGKKLDDGVARNDANAKGTLSIIEAEIYEAVQ